MAGASYGKELLVLMDHGQWLIDDRLSFTLNEQVVVGPNLGYEKVLSIHNSFGRQPAMQAVKLSFKSNGTSARWTFIKKGVLNTNG